MRSQVQVAGSMLLNNCSAGFQMHVLLGMKFSEAKSSYCTVGFESAAVVMQVADALRIAAKCVHIDTGH